MVGGATDPRIRPAHAATDSAIALNPACQRADHRNSAPAPISVNTTVMNSGAISPVSSLNPKVRP